MNELKWMHEWIEMNAWMNWNECINELKWMHKWTKMNAYMN